ncbi:RNA-binding domain-containing protein [Bifidobacterium pullorum]
MGKYFSALSNEANLRGVECGWLLFGVTDKREICGTAYRQEQ